MPQAENPWDFCMVSIREGTNPDTAEEITRTFRHRNSTPEQLLQFLYRRDELGLCPLHWAAYHTHSSHDIVLALVDPIRDHPFLYDVLALRVISPDVRLIPDGVSDRMNLFQINIAQGGTSALSAIQRYNVPGIENVFFDGTSEAPPVLCLAAASRLDAVKSVIRAGGQTLQSHITLFNSSRTLEEGWTSLHMTVVSEPEEATAIISYILSCFGEHNQEKLDFLRLVDKPDGLTALQETAVNDSVEKTRAMLQSVSLTDQQVLLNDKGPGNWTFIHLCAVNNATKILTDMKSRISKENWCDQILTTNSSDETAIHVALNYGEGTPTILILTEFLGSRRNIALGTLRAEYSKENSKPTKQARFRFTESEHLLKILIPTRHPNALHFASYVGDDQLVQFLLKEMPSGMIGDYVSQTDEEEGNFLHVLSNSECGRGNRRNHDEHLRLLHEKSNRDGTLWKLVTQRNGEGHTPSHNALKTGNIDYLLNFIRYMSDVNDVKVLLSQKPEDESSLQNLIPPDHISTQKKLEALQMVVDDGIIETLTKLSSDLQKCIDTCQGVPHQVLREHIDNSTFDCNRLNDLFVPQMQVWCAALAMHIGDFPKPNDLMEKAALGPDSLHIASNMCRLKMQEKDEIGALLEAYKIMSKIGEPKLRLLAQSESAYMYTKLSTYSNFEKAKNIYEEIILDEDFDSIDTSTKLKILSSFVKILPRFVKRTDGLSKEQKQSYLNRAKAVLNEMSNIIGDSDDYTYYQVFCLVWRSDIASQKYDWSHPILDNLREATELLDHAEQDYHLLTRIAKICNTVCYSGMQNLTPEIIEEFYQLGTLCCDTAVEYGFTHIAGFTKVQLLNFRNLQYLYYNDNAWRDFQRCSCHGRYQPGSFRETTEFIKHLRFHHCLRASGNERAILSQARDMCARVDRCTENRIFLPNLSVFLRLEFRFGERADQLEVFIRNRLLNSRQKANICTELGRYHYYEYIWRRNDRSAQRALKLLDEAIELISNPQSNEEKRVHWEALQIRSATSQLIAARNNNRINFHY